MVSEIFNGVVKENQVDWFDIHIAVNPSFMIVITALYLAVETPAKKKVEDVMPIATGHEKEELEAELEVFSYEMQFKI